MTHSLVTGGAGFIGSNLVAELVRRDERVRVLDNFSTGRRENLTSLQDAIELIEGDLRDPSAVARAVEGIDCVFHLGALPSVPGSIEDPLATHAVNTTGTLNLLMAAEAAGVQRLVFSSSCAVYGDSPVLPKVESMIPAPKSPYAASKLAGEHYCQTFTEAFGLPTICLRYFNVFGPRQDPRSQYAAVIPNFVTAMLRGQPPTIYGDGKQSRDFIFVANVVEANLLAADALAANVVEANLLAADALAGNVVETNLLAAGGLADDLDAANPSPADASTANVDEANPSPADASADNLDEPDHSPADASAANLREPDHSPADALAANVDEPDRFPADAPTTGRQAAGRVLNIATGQRHSLLDLVAVLNDLLDTDIAPIHGPPRPGDVRHSGADITAAQDVLGYRPSVTFHHGLRRTVAWYRNRL